MAFGRKWLNEILQNDELSETEKAQKIMDEHITVTNGLKDERDSYKEQADKAADIQKELNDIKGGEDFKKKYDDLKQEFEDFKKQTAQDAEIAKVQAAYRRLLVDEGISEKRLDKILKLTDLTNVTLDKDGNLEDVDNLKKAIENEWGEFRTTVTEKGAVVDRPPTVSNGKKSMDEIYAKDEHGRYKLSTEERQKLIAENLTKG